MSAGAQPPMPVLPPWLLAALGGVAGAFPTTGTINGSGTSTTNTTGETNSNFNQSQFTQGATNFNQLMNMLSSLSGTSTTTPNLTPGTQALIDKLTSAYSTLAHPVDLRGYQAGQIQGINRNADLASQSANNIMASRGLATSPAAATTAVGIDANRVAQINQLNQQLPLLGNTLNLQNLGAAGNFMSMIPHGTTTSQEQTQSQNQSTAGGTQNVQGTQSAGTGYTSTQGSQNTTQVSNQQTKQGGGVGPAAAGIAGILASIFSDRRLKEEVKEIPTDKAVEKIRALRPSTWKWKGGELMDTGLIAQDVEKVLPELVHKEEHGLNKVNYAGLISTLIAAVQGIDKKVEAGVEA